MSIGSQTKDKITYSFLVGCLGLGLFLGVNGSIANQNKLFTQQVLLQRTQVATGRATSCTIALAITNEGTRRPGQVAQCWLQEGLKPPIIPATGHN